MLVLCVVVILVDVIVLKFQVNKGDIKDTARTVGITERIAKIVSSSNEDISLIGVEFQWDIKQEVRQTKQFKESLDPFVDKNPKIYKSVSKSNDKLTEKEFKEYVDNPDAKI